MKTQEFIATFPAGCYEIIARQLKQFSMEDIKIREHDESAVIFKTRLTPEKFIDMRFFTNVYMVLNEDRLSQYKRYLKTESFRLFAFVNGSPAEIDPAEKERLSELIERELQMKPNVSRFSHDFVIHKRTVGEPMLTLRLSRAKHKREDVRAGALRPELANILLLTAAAHANDTLLDPFAGYGSIPTEAVRGFGVRNVIAVEKNIDAAEHIKQKGVKVYVADAAQLHMLHDGDVDKVVTDPPWGIYEEQTDTDLKALYEKSLAEMHRVLKPQGIAVILSGNDVLSALLEQLSGFSVIKSYPVLVSGKKATVYKIQKNTVPKQSLV